MTRNGQDRRELVIRIPSHWAAWQLEWALDFAVQLERRIWTIFEEEHLPDLPLNGHRDDCDHDSLQLELDLGDRAGWTDDDIPF